MESPLLEVFKKHVDMFSEEQLVVNMVVGAGLLVGLYFKGFFQPG